MSTPDLIFENARTGERVTLTGADLPSDPIKWGAQVRREVTRYVGTNNVSAQVLGVTPQDIALTGVFDDSWFGQRGHALAMRLQLEALIYSGDLIRLGYNQEQRWGLLDADFNEETNERILYSLRFEPLFTEPPSPVELVFDAAPVDNATRITEETAGLDALASAPPVQVRDDFARSVLLSWAAAQNALAALALQLGAVLYYADLTSELARQAVRTSAGALRALADMSRQLRGAGASTISTVTTPDILKAELWRDDLLAEVRAMRAMVLRMARDLAAVASPTSARTHTVVAGETLQGLALDYYGDFGLWIFLADANKLDDDALTPGQVLTIPNKPSA